MGNKSGVKDLQQEKDQEKIIAFFKNMKNNANIKEAFDLFDKDKSGYIDKDEFAKFLEVVKVLSKGNEVVESYLSKLNGLSGMDLDKDGKISYKEFLSSVTNLHPQRILLLGPKDAGKSTLLRQFASWDDNEKSVLNEKTSEGIKNNIYYCLLKSIYHLADPCNVRRKFDTSENFEQFKKVEHATLDNDVEFTEETYQALGALWKDSCVQEEYRHAENRTNIFDGFN